MSDPKEKERQDATRQGAEHEDKGQEEHVEHYDPQSDAREAIVARRRQELRDEGLDLPEDEAADKKAGAESEDEGAQNAGDHEESGQEARKQSEKEKEQSAESEEEMVEIKVDGVVEKVKKSDVEAAGGVRALQKERAADKRLQEAAKRKEELDKRERELAEKEQQSKQAAQQHQENQSGGGQQPPSGAIGKKELVDLINKIQYGDAEEAAEAMERVFKATGQPQGQTIDPQQLIQQAKQELHGQQVLDRFLAPPDKGGFGDLKDTRFGEVTVTLPNGRQARMAMPLAAAREEVDRLIKEEGADASSWETYEQAGNTVIERFGLRSKEKNPTPGGKGKQERKRQTDHPRGASPPTGEKGADESRTLDEKRRDTIQDMQRQRAGGAV